MEMSGHNSGEFDRESQRKVGLVYDERMCKHETPDGDDHPECPDRIRAIWYKLEHAGVTQRCVVFSSSKAEDKHLQLVHTKNHVNLVKCIGSKEYNSQRKKIASQFNSIYLNRCSSEAAYLAAGSVVKVAEKVAKGELDSAFAIVRPPGHHAEADEAMGFCLFNNVAVAASFLLNERPDLGVKKILIVDWDVHHGNGTQKMFWKDPHVLFFSVHRHESGSFYPSGDDGSYSMVGEGPGEGFNINVPWENGRCGDADYLAVWDHILVPVAKEFNPDIILVSAGFDAAVRDPLGGCRVTPYGYSVMLKKLMDFARGKIVLALEGGYNLNSIANCSLACLQVLLEDKPIQGSSEAYPFESTWCIIQAVRKRLCSFWPSLANELPSTLIDQKSPNPVSYLSLIYSFFFHFQGAFPCQIDFPISFFIVCSLLFCLVCYCFFFIPFYLKSVSVCSFQNMLISSSDSETEDDEADLTLDRGILEKINKLNIGDYQDQVDSASASWRNNLAKVVIWYATFGSNMWKPRFLCYIQGGQAEGMKRACVGSMDKKLPKEILWQTFPHRLFFGYESTVTWGEGGVAFVHPESNPEEKTHMCLYRITLEQFNDVLFQENRLNVDADSPLFDLTALDLIENKGSLSSSEAFLNGWYGNVVCLGKERGIPILTMTCPPSHVEKFKTGEFPLRPPAKAYANTLIRGLVEGGRLSEEEAKAYIENATLKLL